MKTGICRCGNRIFFNNTACLACEAKLGRCVCCGELTSVTITRNQVTCDGCNRQVFACTNQQHDMCNSLIQREGELCRWCQFTSIVPDLSVEGNERHWAALEVAKRRLLIQLDQLGLPPFVDGVNITHPLTFQFLADSVDASGEQKKVMTGHENGTITINIAEADSVQRERTRVNLDEPQRTLIGHMRHEVGHYIDWSWASRVDAVGYHNLFGDPNSVDYSEAMQRHYDHGPPANWADEHVSQYATMHPWEDFAETVNAYLDIMAIATTANDQGSLSFDLSPSGDAAKIIEEVLKIVIKVSEYNFDLGLAALLPERLSAPVVEKLAYVHSLRQPVKQAVA